MHKQNKEGNDYVKDKFLDMAPKYIYQSKEVCLGLAIGVGGFGEITIIGMVAWILIFAGKSRPYKGKLAWIKDAIMVNIGILLVLYWSYVDPQNLVTSTQPHFCPINSVETLSWKEAAKILVFTLFALVCNHIEIGRIRRLIIGVAVGFSLYVVPTILGSILFQGFRMGGNKIFNIFTGELNAQSTTTGYLTIIIIGIFIVAKSRLKLPAILVGLIGSLQASDKGLFLFSSLSILYICIETIQQYNKGSKARLYLKHTSQIVILIGLAVTAGFLAYKDLVFARAIQIMGVRGDLYITGYRNLISHLQDTSTNALSIVDTNIGQCALMSCDFYSWHSVPLDATKAAGLVGTTCATIWLAALIGSIFIFANRRQYSLCLLNLGLIFIYMTSLPLHTGSYEFISLGIGTILVINEAFALGTHKANASVEG